MEVLKIIKSNALYRNIEISREAIKEDSRSIEISFSSEQPVERWFGIEILDHGSTSAMLERLNSKGPLLLDHDSREQIGVIESAYIKDGKGKAVVRFSKSARAEEIYQDILDGIRANVSVGYMIHEMVLEESSDTGDVYRATRWEPYEVSFVSVPADTTVGVGRSASNEHEITILTREKEKPMEPKPNEGLSEAQMAEIRTNTRNDEISRMREIDAIGATHKMPDLARQFKESGKSVAEFQTAVLAEMEKRGVLKPVDPKANEIGMSDKEKREYSFVRAINAMIRNDWSEAGFEREASIAVEKKLNKRAQGFFVPYDVLLEKRDLSKGTNADGGYTVGNTLMAASFVDLLRNKMMLKTLGAQILGGLVGDITIPRLSAAASAYWISSEGGAPTESQQTFGQISMTPKTVGAFTDMTRKLLQQSSLDVENIVRNDIASILAIAIDLAGINGSGSSGQPTGILGTSGIGAVAGGTNGLAPAWSHIVDLESKVSISNADVGNLAYLTSPKVRGKLKQTQVAANLSMIWGSDAKQINGYRAEVTNQVPDTLTKGSSSGVCSAIIFGNWDDLIIGEWGTLDILVDPYTASTTGTVRVRAFEDCDIAVRRAASFAAMADALTA